ncbi:formate dehydrogenase subunit alpha [Haladaptatus sp. AB618]|uniref:formate dehydrogenase subunit alpha n=1 Tax=Haladaptatus sp. AB618 TaxID=2934173 RepID=UPI00209C244F|nr:formate dehydrogenase subunit alpha [Haladaptatus sp. AB618]MCO8255618.1 formate dehydrogenase subunit alpha [Haladaptatus sp. AB618]
MTDDDTEKKGVAGFMSRAKEQAQSTTEKLEDGSAFEALEHAAESFAANTMSEGKLFETADAVSDYRLKDVDVTDTTCGYCAVGCRFDIYSKDGEVLGVRPNPEKAPINGISTCVKGKFSYEYVNSEDRLTQPLIKENGEFREASWDEAIKRIVAELGRIKERHGADALGVISSSRTSNEANYLMQKFARQVLGTNNIDNCNRLCHSPTVAGLSQTVGFGAASSGIDAFENADCYVMAGSNTTEAHPVLATKIKQNIKDNGADAFVFDPRKIQMAQFATQYSRVKPGYDTVWINGLTRYIIENDLHDEEFIEERTVGFEEVKEGVEKFTPEFVEEKTNVPPEELKNAAETIAKADSCVFCWTLGLTEHSHGTENVISMANLALVTGHVGTEKSGLAPFRGQNNVQGGGGDMGPTPGNFPGYQKVTTDETREKFEDAYGVDLPDKRGLTVTEQFLAADDDEIRGMFVQGENPIYSEPNLNHTDEIITGLDFLAVQDIFLTDTAKHADVVLPANASVETNGTFTSSTRHVQLVKRAVDPPGNAKPDWEITQKLAKRFGYDWGFRNPSEIMDEINELTPIYAGITHERLEIEGSIPWPCWDEDHPGTPNLYLDEFNTDDGKAHMFPTDVSGPVEADMDDEEFPLALTTGRVLYQYHTGTMSNREPGIRSYTDELFAEIHPATAEKLGISDEEYVKVTSRADSITVLAQVTERPSEDVIFVPMHYFGDDGIANRLTDAEHLDPQAHVPEYKVTDVRITPVESESAQSAPNPVAADGNGQNDN